MSYASKILEITRINFSKNFKNIDTKSIEIYGENDNLLKENSDYTILNDDNNSSSITFPYITKVKYIKLTRDHLKYFPGINVTYYNENNMVANLLRTENKQIMYLNFISRK